MYIGRAWRGRIRVFFAKMREMGEKLTGRAEWDRKAKERAEREQERETALEHSLPSASGLGLGVIC